MPKRRRTEVEGLLEDAASILEENASQPESPVERSEEVWLEDGNIVVQAGNYLFKVPHPENEPIVEGCPIVELQDAAEDVEHVLLALYGDPDHTNVRELLPFSALSAMIRLGKKYEMPHLRDEGLARLKLEYPSKLKEYDNLDAVNFSHIHYSAGDDSDDDNNDDTEPISDTIHLAHECGIQSVLPMLYLMFAAAMLSTLKDHPDRLPLPYAALRSCVIGRDRLITAAMDKIFAWIHLVGSVDSCLAPKSCQSASKQLMADLIRYPPNCQGVFNTWKKYSIRVSVAGTLQGLCRPCKEYASNSYEKGREEVWDTLPTYFELPGWQDLKDFDD
ncbi:hypothetical protein NMY22_g1702 [Coprinellus aureogranulatus]|nr:hypothetical protein NMY22_g1702 [Coprinellus aureogranulatus]